MGSSLLRDVAQCRLISQVTDVSGQTINAGLLDPLRWDKWVVKKHWYLTTNVHCIISKKIEDLATENLTPH
jgi:hypothetical protein